MSESADSRCNLVFAGELMPDTSMQRAQQALAAFFGVSDADAMARFLDGRVVALRRNITREEANRLYRRLRSDGLLCRIEPASAPDVPAPEAAAAPETGQKPPATWTEPTSDNGGSAAKSAASNAAAAEPAGTSAGGGGVSGRPTLTLKEGSRRKPRMRAIAQSVPRPEPGNAQAPARPAPEKLRHRAAAQTSAAAVGGSSQPGKPAETQIAGDTDNAKPDPGAAATASIPEASAPPAPTPAQTPAPAVDDAKAAPPQKRKRKSRNPPASTTTAPRDTTALDLEQPPVPLQLGPKPESEPTPPDTPESPAQPERTPETRDGATSTAPRVTPEPQTSRPEGTAETPATRPPASKRAKPPTTSTPAPQPARPERPAADKAASPARPETPAARKVQPPSPAIAKPPPSPPPPPERRDVTPPEAAAGKAAPPAPVAPASAPSTTRAAGGRAPNFFALRPAMGAPDPTVLRERYRLRAMLAGCTALAIAVLTLGLSLRFPAVQSGAFPALAALASTGDGQLTVLADNALFLHGRSGRALRTITAADLGLASLAPPLHHSTPGTAVISGSASEDAPATLWRCDLEALTCAAALQAPLPAMPDALTSANDGTVLFVHAGDVLQRFEAGVERASTPLPGQRSRLLYEGGLLRLPASEGPLLGVYRPDRANFGQQLDALLLLPEPAMRAPVKRIVDIARPGADYWALLESEEGERGLFRFDADWAPRDRAELPADFQATGLAAWNNKLLVAGNPEASLLRFSAEGQLEAPLLLSQLAERQARWQQAQELGNRGRRAAIATALLLALAALSVAAFFALLARHLDDKPPTRSALLDPMPAGIAWLPQHPAGPSRLRKLMGLLGLLAALLPLALLLSGAGWQTLAAAPALLATLRALPLLQRGHGGHCGLLPERLIAVDYDGRYCYAPRAAAQHNGSVLLLGAVAVALNGRLLPNLLQSAPLDGTQPLGRAQALAGLFVRGHPWAHALAWVGAGWLLTLMLLALAV